MVRKSTGPESYIFTLQVVHSLTPVGSFLMLHWAALGQASNGILTDGFSASGPRPGAAVIGVLSPVYLPTSLLTACLRNSDLDIPDAFTARLSLSTSCFFTRKLIISLVDVAIMNPPWLSLQFSLTPKSLRSSSSIKADILG